MQRISFCLTKSVENKNNFSNIRPNKNEIWNNFYKRAQFTYSYTYEIKTDKAVLGTISILIDSCLSIGFIYDFIILKNYRGKGYGKSAFKKFLKLFKRFSFCMFVSEENTIASKIYKECKFQKLCTLADKQSYKYDFYILKDD